MKLSHKIEQKNVAVWCFFLSLAILIMTILGGLTRLTGSGLSIVEWAPVAGILPPLDKADWVFLFEKYQQSPEFTKINAAFSLQQFKGIFWLEYIHRLWGRLLGLFFLVPWGYFLYKKNITPKQALLFIFLFCVGFGQGVMGWYMVKSGLVNDPWVSPYRLGAHLLLAAFLMASFVRLGELFMPKAPIPYLFRQDYPLKLLTLCLLFLMGSLFWGALVAGNKAGLIYNTFPKMDNHWLPEGPLALESLWRNFFENHGMVQFIHRLLALGTLLLGGVVVYKGRAVSPLTVAFGGAIGVQFTLGIVTLCLGVPVCWAVVHQAWALITLSIGTFLWSRWRRSHQSDLGL